MMPEKEETLIDRFIKEGKLVQDGKPEVEWLLLASGRQLLVERRMYERSR